MNVYDATTKPFGYSDNQSISSTDTAAAAVATTPQHNTSSAAQHTNNLYKINSAFMPEDPTKLAAAAAAAAAVNYNAPNGNILPSSQSHSAATTVAPSHQLNNRFPADSHIQSPSTTQQSPLSASSQSNKRPREEDGADDGTPGGELDSIPSEPVVTSSNGLSMVNTTTGSVDKRSGRRKIKIEYIEDKSRRHITFSKRKAGIMKKAYELSTLTGTQVLLLVVSETGLVYTFTTPKLQPIVTQSEGKNLIQACLSAPDQPGEQIIQPIPTESNPYMSQPRHHNQYHQQQQRHANNSVAATMSAMAAAAAASGGDVPSANGDAAGSPHVSTAFNGTSYLQYPAAYGQGNMAVVATANSSSATADSGTAAASLLPPPHSASAIANYQHPQYSNGIMTYTAAMAAAAAGIHGYTSYPNSNNQSPLQQQQPASATAVVESSASPGVASSPFTAPTASSTAVVPAGMNTLANAGHYAGYGNYNPTATHYAPYNQPQHHYQGSGYHGNQDPIQMATGHGTNSPVGVSSSSVSAAMAAAAVAVAANNGTNVNN